MNHLATYSIVSTNRADGKTTTDNISQTRDHIRVSKGVKHVIIENKGFHLAPNASCGRFRNARLGKERRCHHEKGDAFGG